VTIETGPFTVIATTVGVAGGCGVGVTGVGAVTDTGLLPQAAETTIAAKTRVMRFMNRI
jgi:hypothetical protein